MYVSYVPSGVGSRETWPAAILSPRPTTITYVHTCQVRARSGQDQKPSGESLMTAQSSKDIHYPAFYVRTA
jgi:hypothetical protein